MSPRIPLALVLALAVSLVAGRAAASVARAIAFDEKVDRAEAVILGKCVHLRTEWDPAHRWILTYSTFKVEKVLKGPPSDELTLVTPGGTIDGIHQGTSGVRPFR